LFLLKEDAPPFLGSKLALKKDNEELFFDFTGFAGIV
jgi:hypothetical protein